MICAVNMESRMAIILKPSILSGFLFSLFLNPQNPYQKQKDHDKNQCSRETYL